MKRQTLVLDINELYQVVPEAKVLEGKNFKDIRELLKKLIAAVEESGEWEFIQHVQNKPSLFVIREIQKIEVTKATPQAGGVSKTQFKLLEQKINTVAGIVDRVEEFIDNPAEAKASIKADIQELKKQTESIYDSDLFHSNDKSPKEAGLKSESTLPWENK
jgi:hypothetical protein